MKEIADYKPIIIGVDHGYGNIKTEHCVFPSGVERTEAAIVDNHLCLDIKNKMDRCAVSPVGDGVTGTDPIPEKIAHKAEITEGAANLMRQLSGEDEE